VVAPDTPTPRSPRARRHLPASPRSGRHGRSIAKSDNGGGVDQWNRDSFEPRDAVKGDVARMIFSRAGRRDGGDGFADLEPNNQVANCT
jgi:hypothetical protein